MLLLTFFIPPSSSQKAISPDKSDPVAELVEEGGVIFWCVNDKADSVHRKVYHKRMMLFYFATVLEGGNSVTAWMRKSIIWVELKNAFGALD